MTLSKFLSLLFVVLQRTSPADSVVNLFLGQIASNSEDNPEEDTNKKSKSFLARYVYVVPLFSL